MNDQHVALVALLRSEPQLSSVELERAGSATAAWDLRADHQLSLLEALGPAALLEQAARDIVSWQSRGYELVSVFDAGYPENLRDVADRPPLLFVHGQLAPDDGRAVAIVGSRRASPQGRATAAAFAQGLAGAGLTIVSGLAAGIDTAAHTATLKANGRTVAVIGTGLDHVYPTQNAPLQHAIARQGAVVSQFWPDTRPDRDTFPKRNALIATLSRATLVIEAAERSGARIAVRHALAHGRAVFLYEGLLDQTWAQQLGAREGVRTVAGPEQVIEAMV